MRMIRKATMALWLICAAHWAGGCVSFDAYRSRFHDPNYIITRTFYEAPPARVAVLPFASRLDTPPQRERSDISRRVFFQHFALLEFEDVELRRVDRFLLETPLPKPQTPEEKVSAVHPRNPVPHMIQLIKKLDVVGMTSVVDFPALFQHAERIEYGTFQDLITRARGDLEADGYVVGIVRDYGRFYAVIASSIGLSTRIELRSAETGALLWRGETRKRNFSVPISLNPIDIPYLLYYTWRNSRGAAMDMLAYTVYRDMVHTIPDLDGPVRVSVRTTRRNTPWYNEPSIWRIYRKGLLPEGEEMGFLLEKRGWYQCEHPVHGAIWIARKYVEVRDGEGRVIRP